MFSTVRFGAIARIRGSYGPGFSFVGLIELILFWCERVRQRRRLVQLDSRELADIGLCRSQALAEHAKPFWQH